MTANRGYQQLRSHLAYLKLTAAAEALPAELDHAREHGLSHTAFLERLLGLEVDATAARRHAGRLRLAGFPAPGASRTSTSTPNPAWTASSSPTSPRCGSSTRHPTCCSSARPA